MRPVKARAKKVNTKNRTHARVLDRKIHHTASSVVGSIEAKLLEFGALGGSHTHEVIGLVVEAFNELPLAFYEFPAPSKGTGLEKPLLLRV